MAALVVVTIIGLSAAIAGDLSYTNARPQTGDSKLVLDNKTAVNVAALAVGNSYSRITAAGTNVVTTNACVLERLVIGTGSGDAASTITLKTGTNTVAVVPANVAREATFNIRLASGLTAVTASTNSLDVTISYR